MAIDSGSFDSPATGMQPNQGSALMRLFQLRQQGATPQAGNNVPLPAAPVSEGSPISMSSMDQAQKQDTGQPTQQPQNFDPHSAALQTAMGALSNYVGSHAKALEADHHVPMKGAQAKVIASQAQPAAPVS